MTSQLARKWKLQVTNDLTLQTGWVDVRAITGLTPTVTPNLEDSSDFDTNGWSSSVPTMNSWTLDAVFNRSKSGSNLDPGQELIRARVGQFDTAAQIGVRWFDRTGGPEANSGLATVTWKPGSNAVKDIESVTATFTGTDVALNQNITNPYNVTNGPVITQVSPAAAGSGKSVALIGSGFTGATAVSIGGTPATSFGFINDGLLTVVLPTGSAGSVNITVTTPIGTSPATAYTRAA